MRKLKLISLLCLVVICSFGQETLTLDQAIALALKNNQGILIAKNETEIAKNNSGIGNAGMLPQVGLNAAGSTAINDTKQKFNNGTDVDKKGAGSSALSAGIVLSWTLFDGMKMFATHDKFNEISEMSQTNLKIEIENTVAAIINNYYALVKQKQLIKAAENDLLLYEERVKVAEKKFQIGAGPKSDLLQARVDKNELQSVYLGLKNGLGQMKISLNSTLARPVETEFNVTDSISITYKPSYDELKTSVLKQNNSLLFQQKNILVNEYALKEMNSLRYPKISLTSNYNFSQTENQVGFILLNQNLGLNAGLMASWTLFNGSNTSRQVKNTKIELMNSRLVLDQTRMVVESSVLIAYNNFKNSLEVLALEEDNFKLAKENVDIALERFRLGNSTSIELKVAQKSFEDAQTRLVNARYSAKTAETELMRLNGMLVK